MEIRYNLAKIKKKDSSIIISQHSIKIYQTKNQSKNPLANCVLRLRRMTKKVLIFFSYLSTPSRRRSIFDTASLY